MFPCYHYIRPFSEEGSGPVTPHQPRGRATGVLAPNSAAAAIAALLEEAPPLAVRELDAPAALEVGHGRLLLPYLLLAACCLLLAACCLLCFAVQCIAACS